MKTIEVAAFMLIKDNKILVEKRKLLKKYNPGEILIPSGCVESNETVDNALIREIKEELSITPKKYKFLCTLLNYYDDHIEVPSYYLIKSWEGRIKCNEADSLLWISIDEVDKLDIEVDKIAINEYKRIFRS